MEHLLGYRKYGADVLGIYPLFAAGTCRFIVFDFDNDEKGVEKTDFANGNDEWSTDRRGDALPICFCGRKHGIMRDAVAPEKLHIRVEPEVFDYYALI